MCWTCNVYVARVNANRESNGQECYKGLHISRTTVTDGSSLRAPLVRGLPEKLVVFSRLVSYSSGTDLTEQGRVFITRRLALFILCRIRQNNFKEHL